MAQRQIFLNQFILVLCIISITVDLPVVNTPPLKMSKNHPAILHNHHGMYRQGVAFDCTKWASIIQRYEREFQEHGSCSAGRLASLTHVSKRSAKKAIDHYHNGYSIVPIRGPHGHGYSGVGSLTGMTPGHDVFLFQLYMTNPSRPLVGYNYEFLKDMG